MEVKASVEELEEVVERFRKETEGQMVAMKKDIEVLKNDKTQNPSYAEVLGNFTKETECLKEKIEKIEHGGTVSSQVLSLPKPALEPTIAEIQERERRAHNVLIFGLKETDKLPREERLKSELAEVKKFLQGVNNGVDLSEIKHFRIGRYDPGKIRPVKVVFRSRVQAYEVLKFKNKNEDSSVYIKYDQTSSQREYLRLVLRELEDRKSKGEGDLRIRYVNNLPKIIKNKGPKSNAVEPKN